MIKFTELGNGIYSFEYKTTKGETKTVKLSQKTLCYIDYDDDVIYICDDDANDIPMQCLYDFDDRCDLICLGVYCKNVFPNVKKLNAERWEPTPQNEYNTNFGKNWFVNIDCVKYVICGDAKIRTSNNKFEDTKLGIVKFPGVCGTVLCKDIDVHEINYIITSNNSNTEEL